MLFTRIMTTMRLFLHIMSISVQSMLQLFLVSEVSIVAWLPDFKLFESVIEYFMLCFHLGGGLLIVP